MKNAGTRRITQATNHYLSIRELVVQLLVRTFRSTTLHVFHVEKTLRMCQETESMVLPKCLGSSLPLLQRWQPQSKLRTDSSHHQPSLSKATTRSEILVTASTLKLMLSVARRVPLMTPILQPMYPMLPPVTTV